MNRRTTFALDDITIDRMRRLSARWRVSQAEVVRRAIELAERHTERETESVLDRLRVYQRSGKLDMKAADTYLGEVAENRSEWGRGE